MHNVASWHEQDFNVFFDHFSVLHMQFFYSACEFMLQLWLKYTVASFSKKHIVLCRQVCVVPLQNQLTAPCRSPTWTSFSPFSLFPWEQSSFSKHCCVNHKLFCKTMCFHVKHCPLNSPFAHRHAALSVGNHTNLTVFLLCSHASFFFLTQG